MSDVAQILGLGAPNGHGADAATPAGNTPKTSAQHAVAKELENLKPTAAHQPKAKSKTKKLTGMQREVLELLESNHRANHALYPSINKMTLKQKWIEHRDRPAVKWVRKSFHNPARAELAGEQEFQGGLALTHWGKAHVPAPDYVFARFNVRCEVFTYTKEEYSAVLESHSDPVMKWTKAETDVLFELCASHDLRWIVVADKYNTHEIAKAGTFRSVEDLKYRYYEVVRLISEYRDEQRQRAARGREDTDKKMKQEQKQEELVEAASERESIKKEDGAEEANPLSAPPSTAKNDAPKTSPEAVSKYYRFNLTYEKQRKRQLELAFTRSVPEENEIRRLTGELRTVENQLKKVAVKVDTKNKKEVADAAYEIQRVFPTGVFLRSATLALPVPQLHQSKQGALSNKLLKKMELMLDEMGVPRRPMPTKPVCELYDALRQETVGLLSLRKHLVNKQSEVQTLKERYEALTGNKYTAITPPGNVRNPGRRKNSGGSGAAGAASSVGNASNSATPPHTSKGKSLKTAEKQFRSSNKRRGSGSTPGAASKRNKKVL